MKTNSEEVLFEATVMDAYKTNTTDPPSEVIFLTYKIEPVSVYNVEYNSFTGQVEKDLAYIDDNSWTQITLPVFNGLKVGDKIKIIKV